MRRAVYLLTAEKQSRTDASASMSKLEDIEDVGWWLEHDDPLIVNRLLSAWIRVIVLRADGTMEVTRR